MERGRERPREGARGDEAAWAGRAPGAPSWRDSDPPHGEPGGRGSASHPPRREVPEENAGELGSRCSVKLDFMWE